MRSILCKIWSFVLGVFVDILDAVAYALTTVGEVLLVLAKGLGEVAGDVINDVFGGSNLLVWGVFGVFVYAALFKRDKETGNSNYTDTIRLRNVEGT